MPEYSYVALDSRGKEVRGKATGALPTEVRDQLRRDGLFVTEITAGGTATVVRRNGAKWKRADLVLITMQLAHLLDAGMPVDRALGSLANQVKKPVIRERLVELLAAVQSGQTLSAAMEGYPGLFPSLYVQMVRAGEASGQLEEVLGNLAQYLEAEARRRAQVKSMLTYPAFVVSAALLAAVFVVTFVVPQVQGLFSEFDQVLPGPTRLLLGMSSLVSKNWPYMAVVGLAAVVLAWQGLRSSHWRLIWDQKKLGLPIVGDVFQKLAAARFTRTLGVLLQGGVPMLEALAIAEGASGNTWVAEWVRRGAVKVRDGARLAQALAGGPIPSMALEMVGLGEETGRLENELGKVAETYDFETDVALKRLAAMTEPLIIVFIGVLLAFIIIAVVLPIFSLSAAV